MKRVFILILTLTFCSLLSTQPAQAFVRFHGTFLADDSCEALLSIRRGTNPGDIRLTPQSTYPVLGKNKEDATHYQLRVAGADPANRWVPIGCGTLQDSPPPPPPDPMSNAPDYLLAASWQPSFCEGRGRSKIECITQTADRFDATNLALHGLWPQPRSNVYCGVSPENERLDKDRRWSDLPAIELSDDLYSELETKMPGLASDLHLHEWYKHGTCYSETPEEYYRESLALLDAVNASAGDLFAANIGERISNSEIRGEFDESFDRGAGDRVAVRCNNGMISELQVYITGDIEDNTAFDDLIQAGNRVGAGCSRGEVNPAGFD